MTLAKAQACLSAIVGAGFDATAHLNLATNDWTVRATSATLNIDSSQIDFLVSTQSVIGKVALVEFS